MSSPSLQLDLENALKSYLTQLSIFSPSGTPPSVRPIHAAHSADTEPDGTFLAIIAEPPDWETMIVNAIVLVRFEFPTSVKDPNARAAAVLQQQADTGALIALLSTQSYPQAIADLNIPAVGPDNRPWKGLGFTGWEAAKPEPDGTTETQIVSKLGYEFEVFLES